MGYGYRPGRLRGHGGEVVRCGAPALIAAQAPALQPSRHDRPLSAGRGVLSGRSRVCPQPRTVNPSGCLRPVAVAWDGRPARDALLLDVLDGEVFGLLGPPGS